MKPRSLLLYIPERVLGNRKHQQEQRCCTYSWQSYTGWQMSFSNVAVERHRHWESVFLSYVDPKDHLRGR